MRVVIMAGGRGERLWPRSRTDLPKQFLPVASDETLLQGAARRALRLAPAPHVHVATSAEYGALVRSQVPELPPENLILEPQARNTAACVGLAALHVEQAEPDAVMVMLPADHWIGDEDRFAEAVRTAARVAASGAHLVTIGIRPTRPEAGYGYIEVGRPAGSDDLRGARRVRSFTEKPEPETARRLLEGGLHLWNAGIFVWRTSVILRAIGEHLPDLRAVLDDVACCPNPTTYGRLRAVRRAWGHLEPVSIDHGVLEKAGNILVVPADFAWDDLGVWPSLDRVCARDPSGNVLRGRVLAVESEGSIVDNAASDALVVAFGLRDAVVVHAGDVVLVADKARAPELKRVLTAVQQGGLGDYLSAEHTAPAGTRRLRLRRAACPEGLRFSRPAARPAPRDSSPMRVVKKPWGREVWWAQTGRYVGKLIEVDAGQALSLQYHRRKLETMLFTAGEGVLVLGQRSVPIVPGLTVTIQPGTVHRIVARTDVTLFEVSTPDIDDVVRLEDAYGRAGEVLPAGGDAVGAAVSAASIGPVVPEATGAVR